MSGALPRGLGELGRLETLWLQGNGFEGVIPSEWAEMRSLRRAFLWDNGGLVTELTLSADKTRISEGDVVSAIGITARMDAGSEWFSRFWARPGLSGARYFQTAYAARNIMIAPRGTASGDVVDFTSANGRIASIPDAIPDVGGNWAYPAWSGAGEAEVLIIPEMDSDPEGDERIVFDISGEGISTRYDETGMGEVVTRLVAGNALVITLADNDVPEPTKTPRPKRPRDLIAAPPCAPIDRPAPTGTPTATPTPMPTLTPVVITVDPDDTPEPTSTPARRMMATATPKSDVAAPGAPFATQTAISSPTATPTAVIGAGATNTPTATPTPVATITPFATTTPLATTTPMATLTQTSAEPAATATGTPMRAATVTATPTAEATLAPVGGSGGGGSRPRQPTRTTTPGVGAAIDATPSAVATAVIASTPVSTVEIVATMTLSPVVTPTAGLAVQATAVIAPTVTIIGSATPTAAAIETTTATATLAVIQQTATPGLIGHMRGSALGGARIGVGRGPGGADRDTPTPTPTAMPAMEAIIAIGVYEAGRGEISAGGGGYKSSPTARPTPAGFARADKARLNGEYGGGAGRAMSGERTQAESEVMLSGADVGWPWWSLALLLIAAIIAWHLWRKRREEAA